MNDDMNAKRAAKQLNETLDYVKREMQKDARNRLRKKYLEWRKMNLQNPS